MIHWDKNYLYGVDRGSGADRSVKMLPLPEGLSEALDNGTADPASRLAISVLRGEASVFEKVGLADAVLKEHLGRGLARIEWILESCPTHPGVAAALEWLRPLTGNA